MPCRCCPSCCGCFRCCYKGAKVWSVLLLLSLGLIGGGTAYMSQVFAEDVGPQIQCVVDAVNEVGEFSSGLDPDWSRLDASQLHLQQVYLFFELVPSLPAGVCLFLALLFGVHRLCGARGRGCGLHGAVNWSALGIFFLITLGLTLHSLVAAVGYYGNKGAKQLLNSSEEAKDIIDICNGESVDGVKIPKHDIEHFQKECDCVKDMPSTLKKLGSCGIVCLLFDSITLVVAFGFHHSIYAAKHRWSPTAPQETMASPFLRTGTAAERLRAVA